MARLATFVDLHKHSYSLGLYCLQCDRWGEADLSKLISNGSGNRDLTQSRFRCRDCGGIVDKQVRPPVPVIGTAVGYIGS